MLRGRGWVTLYMFYSCSASPKWAGILNISPVFIPDFSPSFDYSLIYDLISRVSSGSSSSLRIARCYSTFDLAA